MSSLRWALMSMMVLFPPSCGRESEAREKEESSWDALQAGLMLRALPCFSGAAFRTGVEAQSKS